MGQMLGLLYVNNSIISADHLPICLKFDKYLIASSSSILFISFGLKVLFKNCLAKLFIPITFRRLKPHFLICKKVNFETVLALTLFLHFSLNFKKTDSAAATLICCPIILLQSEKKISFRDVKIISDGL